MNIKKGRERHLLGRNRRDGHKSDHHPDIEASLARRTQRSTSLSCLHHFGAPVHRGRSGGRTEMVAGYPWYGTVGRDTFIALPGVVLEQGYRRVTAWRF